MPNYIWLISKFPPIVSKNNVWFSMILPRGVFTPFPPNLKLNVDVYGPMRYQKPVFDGSTWTQRRDNRVLTFSFSGKVGFWGARDRKMLKLWDNACSKRAVSPKLLKLDIRSKKVFWSAFQDATFVKISSKSENFWIRRPSNSKF